MRTWATALLAAALLAGCSGSPASSVPPPSAAATTMAIAGIVQDETFAPVAGASVSLRLLGQSTTTDASGGFRFEGLTPSAYVVDVNATGFLPATLTAEPGAASNASLSFVLARLPSLVPTVEVAQFRGILRCAFEAFIISPSCDTLVEAAQGPSVTDDVSTFELGLRPGWSATVVDVVFDGAAHPGLDGLRLTVRGSDDAAGLGEYQQYAQFHGAESFTAALRPGQEYEGGTVGPVPPGLTLLEFDVYPHSHGWHPGGVGLLGVGAGVDVAFELYASVFYNQDAPEGYSFVR